jgi:hypothetical protein
VFRITPLTKTLLWICLWAYVLIRSYREFRNPLPYLPWLTPYALLLLAGLGFFSVFKSYRNRGKGPSAPEPSTAAEPLTRSDRIAFKAMGVPITIAGLAWLAVSCWLAWGAWIRVAQWPRADAVLLSKQISSAGARLVFQYEVGGKRFGGVAFRWGSEKTARGALVTYQPGTVQKISYNPEDPRQIETLLSYWEPLRLPIFAITVGLLLIAGGVVTYRWSYGRPAP